MQDLIETLVRSIGWLLLKIVTFGRYRNDRASDAVVEAAVGLVSIGAVMWLAYTWWPR